ncbi:hypothetical protein ABIA39_007109 [Nocardia sp. GAS34]|uniref:hypothetical protein n=1 Tax=unclassified Nocardia TaxID=2637762 RepID=UPI003D1C7FE2
MTAAYAALIECGVVTKVAAVLMGLVRSTSIRRRRTAAAPPPPVSAGPAPDPVNKLTAAGRSHQMRRHPDYFESRAEKITFEPARDMAAVFQRELRVGPLPGPFHRLQMVFTGRSDRLDRQPTADRVDGHHGMAALMRVNTNHYQAQRVSSSPPFIQADEPSEDGHASIGQVARSYQATNPTGRAQRGRTS